MASNSAAALASGDPLYLSEILASRSETLGMDEGENGLATLVRVAVVLGTRVRVGREP